MSSPSSFTVELVVYDLSQGMARAMSAQLLGPEHAIDMIPHTAILVYGKEYFFGAGAGISVEDPHVFRRTRGLYPVETIHLGSTSVPQMQFEEWCVQQMNEKDGTYSKHSYDLFRRNCNNFSHDAALQGLRLREGVPSHILEVPDRFLRSPMGQAMAPMLQGMQVSGGIPFVPTAAATATVTPTSAGPTQATAPTASQENNPWANLATSKTTSTAPKDTSKIQDDSGSKPPVSTPTTSKPKQPPSTPFIDLNNRPLLSNDKKTVVICANKFDHDAIREVAKLISNSERVSYGILEQACDALLSYLVQDHHVTFGLMLLRVLVLNDAYTTTTNATAGATTQCVEWTKSQLQTKHHSKLTDPAKCMAWCCLSNMMTSTTPDNNATPHVDMLEYALRDVTTSSRPEVKQSAASFLYNFALTICRGVDRHGRIDKMSSAADGEDHLSDLVVSLLCGSMEAIHEEKDLTTLTRRLLVVGHVVKQHNPAAVQLTIDLGFDDLLKSLEHSNTNDDVETLRQEILALVDFHR